MKGRIGLSVAAAVLLLGGCRDLGVREARNIPLAIARERPPVFWAYQAVDLAPGQRKPYEGRTGDEFTLAGGRFIVQFPEYAGPRSLLTRVGTENGAPVYALRWDRPPYEVLYVAPDSARLQIAPEVWR